MCCSSIYLLVVVKMVAPSAHALYVPFRQLETSKSNTATHNQPKFT
jgi:hypothetical protein